MRKPSQRRALDQVVNNWHRNAPFTESVRSTAGFLWLLVMVLIFGSCAAGIVAGWPQVKQHGCQRADAGANVEVVQCLESQGGVGHAQSVTPAASAENVRGVSR